MFNKLLAATGAVIVLILGLALYDHQSQKVSLNSDDVSWPNCNYGAFVNSPTGIVGVNGGLDFRLNPCPSKETQWFGSYGLYINTGYPGKAYGKRFLSEPQKCRISDAQCLAYNWGYNATKYSLEYANQQAIHSTSWWLDVEVDNSWTNNASVNRGSILGAIDAIRHYVFKPTIGIYSDKVQWKLLVGSWNIGLPVWIATGDTNLSAAKEACVDGSFDSGQVWLSQYTTKIDNNINCSDQFKQTINRLD